MSVIVDLWLWTYFICKVISSRCCCAIINVKATLQECSTKKVVPRQHLRETFNFCSVNPFDATDLSLDHPPTPPFPYPHAPENIRKPGFQGVRKETSGIKLFNLRLHLYKSCSPLHVFPCEFFVKHFSGSGFTNKVL